MLRRALLLLCLTLAALAPALLAPRPALHAQDAPQAFQFRVKDTIGLAKTRNVVKDLRGRVLMLVALNPWGDRCAGESRRCETWHVRSRSRTSAAWCTAT